MREADRFLLRLNRFYSPVVDLYLPNIIFCRLFCISRFHLFWTASRSVFGYRSFRCNVLLQSLLHQCDDHFRSFNGFLFFGSFSQPLSECVTPTSSESSWFLVNAVRRFLCRRQEYFLAFILKRLLVVSDSSDSRQNRKNSKWRIEGGK